MRVNPDVHGTVLVLAIMLTLTAVATGATTEVHIALYASDGFTVLNETTVDYHWMEQNLPVMGDGQTHYYLQGPVFVENRDDRWNPEEDTNVLEKDMGAVKGTDLRDLCELVGGMEPGDTVTVRASDGFSKTFAYENVYEPPARQGPMVITWYQSNQSYVPGYADGMRLVFFADISTNPWAVHAMGNEDWHESAAEEYWYYYYQDQQLYPTTTGLSIKYISDIQISSSREPEGSIDVASDPQGARVFLDGVDTGQKTPCSLNKLSPGSYSVTVNKAGYIQPEEQTVEVVPGENTPASFTMEPASQGGGGSEAAGGDESVPGIPSDQSMFLGGQLTGTDLLHINGSLVLLPSLTPPFILAGGKAQVIVFDVPRSNQTPDFVRLYLFLDSSPADRAAGSGTQVFVYTTRGDLLPIRNYTEHGSDENTPAAMTLVYTLPELDGNGTVTIRNKNPPTWNSTLSGALLMAGYEDPGGNQTDVWVCEGADLIGEIPGQETPLTQAEFGTPSQVQGNKSLFTITTPASAAGNLSFFVNGVSVPAQLESESNPVVVYSIPGSALPENTGFRLHITTTGSPVTNRIALLVINYMRPFEPVPGSAKGNVTIQTSQPTLPPPTAETLTSGENLPIERPHSSNPLGKFLCWFLNVILALEGQPPENCSGNPGTALPANENSTLVPETLAAGVDISVSSSPGDASVYLDDQPTGLITPCVLNVRPEEEHSIRIVKGGYLPFEQELNGSLEVEAVLQPAPVQSGNTPSPLPVQSHHGGVYIHSYPEEAEIRVDGVVVSTSSPVLVSPLKEGFHTITSGILTGDNAYSARKSIRTWIFPDTTIPVDFNMMEPESVFSVNITGELKAGAQFTANGYYPVKRIPDKADFSENPAFITLTNGSSYLSYTVPESSKESGVFILPVTDPPVCNLSIESVPAGTEIFLDGIRTGFLTPAVIPNVSAGYHRITITQKDQIPVTELIHIPESQCQLGEYDVRYSTEWYPSGSLHFTSDPEGASVSIRGIKTGEVTPCTLENIPIGIWEVSLTLGKVKRGIDATVEPGSNRSYSVVFD